MENWELIITKYWRLINHLYQYLYMNLDQYLDLDQVPMTSTPLQPLMCPAWHQIIIPIQ